MVIQAGIFLFSQSQKLFSSSGQWDWVYGAFIILLDIKREGGYWDKKKLSMEWSLRQRMGNRLAIGLIL